MNRFFCAVIYIFVFIFTALPCFAENFYITDYNVNLDVNPDKSVYITEDIEVVFTSPSHGIYRKIPLKKGEEIRGVSVSEQSKNYIENNDYFIKIGNPNKTVTGLRHYKIFYIHQLSGNPNEFYYNIIGTDWNVPIYRAAFSVDMPSAFPRENAGLSIGKYGTKGFSGGAVFYVNDKNVSGETTRILNPKEGITLRIELPQNYFEVPANYNIIKTIATMFILTGICFLIWFIVGRDEHVTPVVSFYPPEKYNSAEAEVLYSGEATYKGLISLVIWLANTGYLSIEYYGDKEKDFTIHKIKDYEYNSKQRYMKNLFDTLFEHGSNEITSFQLKTSYETQRRFAEIMKQINKLKERIWEKDSQSGFYKFIIILCLAGIYMTGFLHIAADVNAGIVLSAVFLGVFIFVAAFSFAYQAKSHPIFMTVWSLGFGGIPFIKLYTIVEPGVEAIPIFITGVICFVISLICFVQLPKRSRYGNKMYGQLLGFKKFLETAELPRIKQLAQEKPNYCYDILPYLYIFDLSDKWMDKFGVLFRNQPEWYTGSNFRHSFKSFTSAVTTNIYSANGGGSHSGGGGGRSGGGSGGGGGGSW